MLIRTYLKRKIQDVECDLLGKEAYVVVRWSRSISGEEVIERAVDRMKAKFPGIDRARLEEVIHAMESNLRAERGIK